MKTLYFDTSYLFRLYSTELGSKEVQTLAAQSETVACAGHGRAEFAAVLHRKKREEAFADAHLEECRGQFADDLKAGVVTLLALDEAVITRLEAAFRTAPTSVFLRAADALHLACAAAHGFPAVYSNDRRFLDAAPLFGLRGINLIPA